jgi:hypothetical protein
MQFDPELQQLIPEGPHRVTVGMRRVAASEWIVDQPDFDAQLVERQVLIDSRDDVIASTEQSLPAQRELLTMVGETLCNEFPERYVRHANHVHCNVTDRDVDLRGVDMRPIEAIGRLVPDDFCLLETAPDAPPAGGDYRLTAAVVCFPTRWRLATKVGLDITGIHGPVPGYDGAVASGVERLFSAIDSERVLVRSNWAILDSASLYQPEREQRDGAAPASIDAFWLRSERQTVRRLPATKAIVFGIRIRQWPIADVLEQPALKGRLLEQIRTMPADMKRYKRMELFEQTLTNDPSSS